jgi:citrate lyase subunit beta/citryl-CoA lyase
MADEIEAYRARRSVLYRLGTDVQSYASARDIDADVLLFDLEDSVAVGDKAAARLRLSDAVARGGFRRQELVVRVNGQDSPWGRDDVAAVAKLPIDGVMLPKAESGEGMRRLANAMEAAGAPATIGLWAMIETPVGVLRAEEIAAAPRMTGIAVGLGDLSRGLRAEPRPTPDRLPMLTSLGLVLLAARAHGLTCIDSSFREPRGADGFEAACRASREFGFDGKAFMEASLMPIANRAYGPTAAEVAWSKRVLSAVASAAPDTAVTVDGQLIEPGYLTMAQRIVAMADGDLGVTADPDRERPVRRP